MSETKQEETILEEVQPFKKARTLIDDDDQCRTAVRHPSHKASSSGNPHFSKALSKRDNPSAKHPPSAESGSGTQATPSIHQSLDLTFPSARQRIPVAWRTITADNLRLDYTVLFPATVATALFDVLEQELEYFTGDLARVKVFGKWHNIPRKQATYGDPGLTYTYSGVCTPARPWPPALLAVRDLLQDATSTRFNFVLVNRYKDGKDKMGEHKDDEKELDPCSPIASVSLGQPRTFYFKHQDDRSKKRTVPKVQLTLEHGSVLLMRPPTNRYWYHALPPRAAANKPRINLTFRSITVKQT